MKILALEFSSSQRSVAVVQTVPGASGISTSEIVEPGRGATRAAAMIAGALREAKLARDQIECLAVGLGPGSYTGIRAALALAQGWQLARQVKLIGLGSMECLAAQAQVDGITGRLTLVIDAQRGEFYSGECEITDTGTVIAPLRIVSLAELRERAQSGDLLIGPEVSRWIPQGRDFFPRAATLGKLALSRNDFVTGAELKPVYLRTTAFVKATAPRILPEV
jgi:tRNA threonylcarbamoyl adenosine modification protein YeaZ